MNRIKVLIVEDSPLTVELIKAMLERDPVMEVVGVAVNGTEAIDMVEVHRPDIITMDVEMSGMDGLEATKQIMDRFPTPILVLSSAIFSSAQTGVFKIISYGALEVFEKDNFFIDGELNEEMVEQFLENVRMLSRIPVLRHNLADIERRENSSVKNIAHLGLLVDDRVLGIVGSTGGPMAVVKVVKQMPQDCRVPIVIVLHISDGFVDGFVNWLNSQVSIEVKVARDGASLLPGVAYVAPFGLHMRVTNDGRINLAAGEKVCGMMPSGTVLFESIAEAFGKRGCGVILTGMGRDGSEGLKKIHDSGGLAMAESESSCVIFGMPKAAIDIGAVDHVVELDKVYDEIIKWFKK